MMSSEYASPPPGPYASSFTPANNSNLPIIITPQRQSSSSPSPTPSGKQRQDDETSSQRSMKRSHSAMEMDIDSPARTGEEGGESKKRKEKSTSARKSDHAPTSTSKGTFAPSGSSRKTYSSVFSGSKIKHLKKPDGEPLWRKDIQYEFLYAIFHDEKKVFTNSYDGTKGHTFADVYIDAMARSSKTSKVLRDKLLSDRPSALNMAMVCLLVNIGRMNTTLNFFPEMRAQLRTYHPIPSLQDYADPAAYKQLQDAPRLKSILKGASEDRREPTTLEQLVNTDFVPRTNPINLCFVLSTYAPKVTQLHFGQPRDFFDLVMRTTLSSISRARAYLWLNWWYLESNFTKEDALNNPYGAGQFHDAVRVMLPENRSRVNSTAPDSEVDETPVKEDKPEEKEAEAESDKTVTLKFKGLPVVVPQFEGLTDEQAKKENVDTEAEEKYGNSMHQERLRKMADPEAALPPPRSLKKSKKATGNEDGLRSGAVSPGPSARGYAHSNQPDDNTDSDATRSASPERLTASTSTIKKSRGTGARSSLAVSSLVNNSDAPSVTRINFRLRNKDGSYVVHQDIPPATKKYSRPLTQHQLAVQANRRNRVAHEIARMVIARQKTKRRERLREGPIKRCWRRIKGLDDVFAKSDDEVDAHDEHKKGNGRYNNGTKLPGPAGMVALSDESDDAGEETEALAVALRRCKRRMARWEMEGINGKATRLSKEEEGDVEEKAEKIEDGENGGIGGEVDDEADTETDEDDQDGGDEMDMSEY